MIIIKISKITINNQLYNATNYHPLKKIKTPRRRQRGIRGLSKSQKSIDSPKFS